jgi:hypothetical protein
MYEQKSREYFHTCSQIFSLTCWESERWIFIVVLVEMGYWMLRLYGCIQFSYERFSRTLVHGCWHLKEEREAVVALGGRRSSWHLPIIIRLTKVARTTWARTPGGYLREFILRNKCPAYLVGIYTAFFCVNQKVFVPAFRGIKVMQSSLLAFSE